jgi:peptidoglycan/LPS O-acetylase OafA/YrhL
MDQKLSSKLRNISFLLMILVAYIHGYNENLRFDGSGNFQTAWWLSFTERFISDGICRIAVPLFFAISGFLAMETMGEFSFHKFGMMLRSRFRSLLLPYLLVSLLGIIVVIGLQLVPFAKPYFNNYDIHRLSFRNWIFVWLFSPVPFQLWFIRFLIGYILFFPVIYFLLRHLRPFILLLPLYIWVSPLFIGITSIWSQAFSLGTLVFGLMSGLKMATLLGTSKIQFEGLLFFSIGVCCSLYKFPMVKKPNLSVGLTLLVLWLFWIGFRTKLTVSTSIDHYEVHYHLVAFTLVGSILIWYLYDLIAEKVENLSWIRNNARYSIGVFLFHEPILTIFKKLLIKAMGQSDLSLLVTYIIAPAMAVAFSVLLSRKWSMYWPGTYSLFTGNRMPKKVTVEV